MTDFTDLRKFMAEEFRIEVTPASHLDEPGAYVVRETHNGYQWSTIQLHNKKEVRAAIKALQQALKEG